MSLIVVLMLVTLGVLYYRRRRFERDLELMLWKIDFFDIVFMKGSKMTGSTRVVSGHCGRFMTFGKGRRGSFGNFSAP